MMRARKRTLATGGFAFAVMVLCASAGAAVAPDRAEYVSSLESICKPGVETTQEAVRGVRSDIKAERLAVAAGKLGKAARIFDGTVRQISAVPRPPQDASHLAKWFGYLKLQESYLGRAATALRAEKIPRYQHNAVLFVHNGNLANDVVIAYGFNYCRFKFSRFS
jgi:hypothetical protein